MNFGHSIRVGALVSIVCASLLGLRNGPPVAAQTVGPFALVNPEARQRTNAGSLFSLRAPIFAEPYVYFQAETSDTGSEFWRTDGSEAGTIMIRDICPGIDSGINWNNHPAAAFANKLFFAATDCGARGNELWVSDGSEAGTVALVDGPGAPVNPQQLSAIDGKLYFSAGDEAQTAGRELWHSDGTAQGTAMLQDLNPGPGSSNPEQIIKAGQRIFLSAFSPVYGSDVWSAEIRAATPTPPPATATGPATPVASAANRALTLGRAKGRQRIRHSVL
jgi:ELWxxDGT repeat protein